MKNAYMLIFTDGYSINTERFSTYESALAAMNSEYNARNNNEPDDEWDEESYNDGIGYAILYDRGENVFVWSIETL